MKRSAVVSILGIILLCSACGDGGAGATATAVYEQERATLEAYYTQSAALFTAIAGEAEELAADGTEAVATQAALQASLAALEGDFVTAEAAYAAQAAAQASLATAAGRAIATEQARARATQADLQTAVAVLATQAADAGQQRDALQATGAAQATSVAAALMTATAHIDELADGLGEAGAQLEDLQGTVTPLAGTIEALQTETYNLALTPAPTATLTPWMTFIPPPTGTPPINFGPLYRHSSGVFKIMPPAGWTERTGEVEVTWTSPNNWFTVIHVFYEAYGPDVLLHRFGVLLYAFATADHSFEQYDSYRITGFDPQADPMTMDFEVYSGNQPYRARQWFGFQENIIWFVRVVVPASYPELLDYLGERLVATLEVYPQGQPEPSALLPLPPVAWRE